MKIPNARYSFQHFLKGLLANMSERDTWRYNSGEYDDGKARLLCPVIWCSWGGWVLIMKRAEPMPEHYSYATNMAYFPGDDKPDNYGLLDGRVVKIDYGQ